MKTAKIWLLMTLVVAVAGITALRLITEQKPSPMNPGTQARPAQTQEALPPEPTVLEITGGKERPPVAPGTASQEVATPKTPKLQEQNLSTAKKTKEPLQDPLARVALAFVGADSQAEAYWCEAINDPSLSAHERSDLIEDLNEDGLSDPKRPTMEDFPLIINRLRLIQELVPNAMDQVNYDAFAEAYKDLLNLADVALGGGEPVR